MAKVTLRRLKERGFDRSYKLASRGWKVACSQCEALVINGVACHESGCPNKPCQSDRRDDA